MTANNPHNRQWFKVDAKTPEHQHSAKLLEKLMNHQAERESADLAERLGKISQKMKALYEKLLAECDQPGDGGC